MLAFVLLGLLTTWVDALVPVLGWLVLVVVVGFLPGTPGANQYGRDPRTAGGAAWTS